MCKDIYLEGKAFSTANQRKGDFIKRKIYQEFLQDKQCDPGLCSWRWCVFEDNGNCLRVVWLPPPVSTRQLLTSGHQPAVQVVMKTVNHLTFIWPHVVPPGYHFFTLSFVDAPVLLANDINRSVVSHLWAVAIFSKALGLESSKFTKYIHAKDSFSSKLFVLDLTLKRTEAEISVCVCACACACMCGCLKGKSWKSTTVKSRYIMKGKKFSCVSALLKVDFLPVIILILCQAWYLYFSLWSLFVDYAHSTSTPIPFLKGIRVAWPACLSGEAGLLKPGPQSFFPVCWPQRFSENKNIKSISVWATLLVKCSL